MKYFFFLFILVLLILGCDNNSKKENTITNNTLTSESNTNSNIQITLTSHDIRSEELVKSELIAKNKAIEDTKQKIEKDKQIEDLKIQAFINDAKVMRSEIEIDKYKFNYSDKWELINRSDKSITLQGTDSNFVFNISETPSSQIVDFTSYLIQSSDLNLLSKKILSDYVGYIIEAEDKDNNIHKIITMSSVHNELIILSIISSKQNWELNSELFDLTFQSLLANQK
tara:strand:+ start:183 stop:863 length:681 start_codon:yes stop_codon:yes gene_type:complete